MGSGSSFVTAAGSVTAVVEEGSGACSVTAGTVQAAAVLVVVVQAALVVVERGHLEAAPEQS